MIRRELNGAESTSVEVLASRRAQSFSFQSQIEKQIEALTKQIDELEEKASEEAAACEADVLRFLGYVNAGAPEGQEIPLEVATNLRAHLSGEQGAIVLEWEAPSEATETVTEGTDTVYAEAHVGELAEAASA